MVCCKLYTQASTLVIPFLGLKAPLTLPVVIAVPFSIFVLVAFSNAVNLTDGLDGLAGTVTTIVLLFLTVMSTFNNEWNYISTFCAILAGGVLGFLVFNLHPAKIFMGDVGALALGGALSAMSLMTGAAIYLAIAGIIYVAEALSVVIQVGSRGPKRSLLMAPLHHHYEYKGWRTKVVIIFSDYHCCLRMSCVPLRPKKRSYYQKNAGRQAFMPTTQLIFTG